GVTVFCEVKTRTSDAYGVPAEAVTSTKQRKLRLLAMTWLDEARGRRGDIRFDVACVLAGDIEVIEGAF
ncbi:MAG: YraN family protein, partial [Acidimicrobiales bacterium]